MGRNPGVDTRAQPRETRRHEQRTDGAPYGMTGAQCCSDSEVTAGNLAVFTDPLNGCSTLVRGQTERVEIQLLPGGDARGAIADHPPVQEPGGRGAEPAVTVEDQDRLNRHVAQPRGHASTRRRRASSSSIGSALVCAMIGRKFESPLHLGTTCWCRWARMPAPATAPWLIPML